MKILMLSWEYPPRIVGGISMVVHDLSHRLISDGHEVTVITYRDGDAPYFEDDKEHKFTLKNMHQDYKENRELYTCLYSRIIPRLEEHLSVVSPEELEIVEEEFDY